jgi:hypothetical protein
VTVLLIVAYVALTAICAVEKRWPVCLYWVGAAIVTGGVLWMSTRMEISK